MAVKTKLKFGQSLQSAVVEFFNKFSGFLNSVNEQFSSSADYLENCEFKQKKQNSIWLAEMDS